MANKGVKGRVIDVETNAGIKGLTVTAVDFDPFFNEDDVLGSQVTDDAGNFHITYSEGKYSLWKFDRRPDIVVQVYTASGRLLCETQEVEDVSDETLDVPDIKLHKKHVEGWLVTHATLKPEDGSAVALFKGNEITYLVDGGAMFPAITKAAKQANTYINLMTLFFNVGTGLITEFKPDFDPHNPPSDHCKDSMEATLEEVLKTKAKSIPNGPSGLPINVLVTNLPVSAADTVKEVREFFKDTTIKTSDFNKGFGLLHAKAIIFDGFTAILMGSPIKQTYFSDQQHAIHDARHKGSLFHDMNVQVAGPAVAHIDKTFNTIWKVKAELSTTFDPVLTPRSGPNVASVQVLRTLPGGTFKKKVAGDEDLPHGETGILEAYQRAIANADHYIYIENQYFTAPEITSALIARMKEATRPKLQIILLLNFRPDLPGYPNEQVQIVNQLKIAAEGNGHQLGIYTLWSRTEKQGSPPDKKEYEIMPVYVHSKTAIIDDVWATTGSGNLDGTSLNAHQFRLIAGGVVIDQIFDFFAFKDDFGKFLKDAVKHVLLYFFKQLTFTYQALLVLLILLYEVVKNFSDVIESLKEIGDLNDIRKDVFTRYAQHALPHRSRQPSRSVEMNVAIYNGVDGEPASAVVQKLREQLWTEHLGLAALPPELQTVPTDPSTMQWVKFWNDVAKSNQEAIQQKVAPPADHAPKILKWTGDVDASHYLQDLKISTKNLREEADKYDFDKCKFVKKKKRFPWLPI